MLTHKDPVAEAAGAKVAPKISRRKALVDLEKDAWFSPDEFYAEVAELAG